MEELTLEQQELKEWLGKVQKIAEQSVPAMEKSWDMWLNDYWGKEKRENMLFLFLEALLFASQCESGKALFIKVLEYIKTDYPDKSLELWELYDNWDNIHKTDYYRRTDE